ncbi:MAG: peptidoglycan-binding protein [Acidobacteriaceae bacterium]|nr:peptidoglycan-binding protein [Acidobacteriaceae bacterium]
MGVSQPATNFFLKRGCQGQDVLDLQCALATVGAYTGNFDGGYGGNTEAALRTFQKGKSLPPSGILDSVTAQILGFTRTEPATCPLLNVTTDLAARLFEGTPRSNIEINLPYVLNALVEALLADKQIVAVALATIRVEASSFLPVSELPSALNTSPGGAPFDLYDYRASLGNGGPPDGSQFRGRGFVQLTGRANFLQFGKEIGLGQQLVTNPLKAHQSAIAAKILAAFLRTHETRIRTALAQNRLADVRRLVNGGSNGLGQFTETFKLAMQLLPDQLAA